MLCREVQRKQAVNFSDDGLTVAYVNNKIYFWNENVSCATCNLDDEVVVPNIVLAVSPPRFTYLRLLITCVLVRVQSMADMATKLNMNHTEKGLLFTFLQSFGESLYVRKTVRQLLFEGYKDLLVSTFSQLRNIAPAIAAKFDSADSRAMPDRIGLFYGVRQ